MPSAIRVVSREKYEEWLAAAKKKYSAAETPVKLASSVALH